MLVEDEPHLREVTAEVLRFAGYDVIEAANGLDALHLLAGATPALILLDLTMPVMDGTEFIKEFRRRPTLAQIPILLVSAEHDIEHRASALGVSGALAKDSDVDVLLAAVDALSVS